MGSVGEREEREREVCMENECARVRAFSKLKIKVEIAQKQRERERESERVKIKINKHRYKEFPPSFYTFYYFLLSLANQCFKNLEKN